MINFALVKIIRFFYRILSKIIYFTVPIISKVLIILRLNSRIINQLNKLRYDSHRNANHKNLILKLLGKNKIVALDVGAQGGFLNNSLFDKKYNIFFDAILVEPIPSEAEKLLKKNYKVIPKGLWSSNCKKKLYVLGDRPGSSSMYKPDKDSYDLYNYKKNNFSLFNISKEINVECTTIKDSLSELRVDNLDFLKVDTQGAELEILKGLGEYRPLMMKIEAQIVPMYKDVPNWTMLTNYLYNINYMTCEWTEIGPHLTRAPVEMDMIFIPNYLNDEGKKIILSKEKEFTSLMIIFGQIKLLQTVAIKLNFSLKAELQNLKDHFFN